MKDLKDAEERNAKIKKVGEYLLNIYERWMIAERPKYGQFPSQNTFAHDKLRIPQATWSNWASGRQMPVQDSVDYLVKIAPDLFGDELYAVCGYKIPMPEDPDIRVVISAMRALGKPQRQHVVEIVQEMIEDNKKAREKRDQQKMQNARQKQLNSKPDDFDLLPES